jgi:glutamate racemase
MRPIIGPVGLFDSGLGGLSVAREVMRLMPGRGVVYIGDNAHVPYGERPLDEVRSFALGLTRRLIEDGAGVVVMACNMSSAIALPHARELYDDVHILGVIEPGAQAAVQACGGAPIGVLATTGTVRSGAYVEEVRRIDGAVEVYQQACPKFVPLVESGNADSEEAEAAVLTCVEPLLARGCRTLILGCTHYPFMLRAIRHAAGDDVTIIDPAVETAKAVLEIVGPCENEALDVDHRFCATGETDIFGRLAGAFLGKEIVDIESMRWGRDLFCASEDVKTGGSAYVAS